jgi:hypothetical protein
VESSVGIQLGAHIVSGPGAFHYCDRAFETLE